LIKYIFADVFLVEIIGMFEEAALVHAKKMIDEYHLQSKKQTTNVKGGVPGAMSVDGMILHFACDYDGN
jgi:hypothetical protein